MKSKAFAVMLACLLNPMAHGQPSDWSTVQRIDTGQLIRIGGTRPTQICAFTRADDSFVFCDSTRTYFFIPVTRRVVIPKAQVRSIRLSRQPLSILTGAAIGVGAGAAIGAAIDASAQNQVEEGHLITVILALFGALIGSSVGQHTDFLAGPVIYRAP